MSDREIVDRQESGTLPVSRRNLFGGIALSMLLPQTLSASEVANKLAALDKITLHNLLRGLVLLEQLGDPVIVEDAAGLVEQITTRLPEAPLLMALYRDFFERRALGHWREEDGGNLAILHHAMAEAHPVSFDYIDLEGAQTSRRVLPLALQHPAHGIQLLAWCELRRDYRRFFAGAMLNLTEQSNRFAERRLALLEGLLASEGIEV